MSTTVILCLCAYSSRSAWASSMEFLQGKSVTPLPELQSFFLSHFLFHKIDIC